MGRAHVPAVMSLAALQGDVVSRQQCEGLGVGPSTIATQVDQGVWVRLLPGLVQVRPGEPSLQGLCWGGHLLAGPDSVIIGRAAGALHGLCSAPEVVEVAIPEARRVRAQGPWQFTRRRVMPVGRGGPPRAGVEATVLDLCEAQPRKAEQWVTEACRLRLTTRARLRLALRARRRFAGRRALETLLADSQEGVESPLEGLYLRKVERAHGLPGSVRQFREGSERRDVWYEDFGLVVELDGRTGHEGSGRFRDMARDNANVLRGRPTLRFGFTDCEYHACLAAQQVGAVLRALGWAGWPTRCGGCPTISAETLAG